MSPPSARGIRVTLTKGNSRVGIALFVKSPKKSGTRRTTIVVLLILIRLRNGVTNLIILPVLLITSSSLNNLTLSVLTLPSLRFAVMKRLVPLNGGHKILLLSVLTQIGVPWRLLTLVTFRTLGPTFRQVIPLFRKTLLKCLVQRLLRFSGGLRTPTRLVKTPRGLTLLTGLLRRRWWGRLRSSRPPVMVPRLKMVLKRVKARVTFLTLLSQRKNTALTLRVTTPRVKLNPAKMVILMKSVPLTPLTLTLLTTQGTRQTV